MLSCYVHTLVYVAAYLNSQAVNSFSVTELAGLPIEKDQISSRQSRSMSEKLQIKTFLADFQSFDVSY